MLKHRNLKTTTKGLTAHKYNENIQNQGKI